MSLAKPISRCRGRIRLNVIGQTIDRGHGNRGARAQSRRAPNHAERFDDLGEDELNSRARGWSGRGRVGNVRRHHIARKQAENMLQASEEQFRSIYDNATIGLYRTTPDGRILMLNPAGGVRMLGL